MSLMIYTPVDLIVGGEEEIQKEEVGLDVTVWSLPFTAAVLEMAIEVNGNELRRRYQWYHTIPQYLVAVCTNYRHRTNCRQNVSFFS